MSRRAIATLTLAFCVVAACALPATAYVPPSLRALSHDVRTIARHVPAAIALDVLDLDTGYTAGFNASQSMPAASTIKVPVMVEVFDQLEAGRFDLNRRVELTASDKDYGSGDLCDAPVGETFSVEQLLAKMIDISDNTATNMLIRLVGRRSINAKMGELGLRRTHLAQDVRTDDWAIRRALRTSAGDLVHLLALMAHGELVDEWSSKEMIGLLEADQINTLLPAPLPENIPIAHKTGSLVDTLNDAGIVYAADAPYVIAVMTTALPSKDLGRAFIHTISRLAYADELQSARWRTQITPATTDTSPDVPYWDAGSPTPNPQFPRR
ncbi:MAG: serine hydrolase [Candidatus Eremiobacteraeota bacterium]|nr:serine hydrolase [Candidatus Eremiobacteraeota bacterium]MBV9055290.1 serine hydrolase [Candidatus Eremiobacteraeota bacterium]MBV9698964.1 serine hydrolase [Candidatus Eremiobacteraeota bacterium]